LKKLIVFLGILALVLGTGGVVKVLAAPYGTDVTIYDQAPVDNVNKLLPAREDGETEPGCINNQSWDLEGYQQSTKILTVIGGFDFASGKADSYTEPLGALFFKIGSVAPGYGAAAPPIGNQGTGDAYSSVANSLNWKYDYAIQFAFDTTHNIYTYTLWQDQTGDYSAKVILHGPDGAAAGDVSNPWNIGTGWTQIGGTNTFTYLTGQTDAQTGYLGGSHNVITGIDLSFLIDPNTGVNDLTWLHLTYGCGNDNLMGQVPYGSVPLPPSVLLLGSGLVGLVGLGWKRKARAS
jgi:hypothetical protein